MPHSPDKTLELLQRWHRGDAEALNRLLSRNLPYIKDLVHRRLGPGLRAKAETVDFMQDAMVRFLRYGPRFLTDNEEDFRALMARIVENVLRDQNDFFSAQRRDMHRERPLPPDSVIPLDPGARSVTRPSQAAERHEEEAWVRLALELMNPEDRKVIALRTWHEFTFAEIGRRLDLSENTVRARFNRAMPKLARKVEDLRQGHLQRALKETDGRVD